MIDDDADFPLTQEAEDFLAIIERRIEQGLAHYPFQDGAWSHLVRLNDDGTPYSPSNDEILRLVSGWFVKKDNKFHDVNNLQTTYQAQDLKQVIVSRIKVIFPKLELTNKDLKDFFLVLLDPPISNANPERSNNHDLMDGSNRFLNDLLLENNSRRVSEVPSETRVVAG